METGGADVDVFRLEPQFGDQPLERRQNDFLPGGFLSPLRPQRLDGKRVESQPALLIDFELGELEAARPKINGQKRLGVKHCFASAPLPFTLQIETWNGQPVD